MIKMSLGVSAISRRFYCISSWSKYNVPTARHSLEAEMPAAVPSAWRVSTEASSFKLIVLPRFMQCFDLLSQPIFSSLLVSVTIQRGTICFMSYNR